MSDFKNNTVMTSLDYSNKSSTGSTYRYNRIFPESPVVLDLVSTSEARFSIPATVLNLSRSGVELSYLIPATSAGTSSIMRTSNLPIQRIQLISADNAVLVDIVNVQEYTKTVWPVATPVEKYLSMSKHDILASNLAQCNQVGEYYAPHGHEILGGTEVVWPATGDLKTADWRSPLNNDGNSMYDELDLSDVDQSANNVAPSQEFIRSAVATSQAVRGWIDLGKIVHTFLSVDKSLYFNSNLTLVLTFARASDMGFTSSAGAAVVYANADGTANTTITMATAAHGSLASPTPLIVLPVIPSGGCILHLAVESNRALAQTIKETTLASGATVRFPYVYSYKRTLTAAGVTSQLFNFNATHGRSLKIIYSSTFNPNQTGGGRLMHYNHGGLLYTEVASNVNSEPLSNETLSVANGAVYRSLKNQLHGSCITNNKDWNQHACYFDNFSGMESAHKLASFPEHSNGVDLISELKYSLDYTTTVANSILHVFAVTEKVLRISELAVNVTNG